MGRKQLYESVQALENIVNKQNRIIAGFTTDSFTPKNNINPIIQNSADYVAVLSVTDRIKAVNRYITDIPELELPSNRLETLWYRYGSLCFYTEDGRPWVGSYAKEGELNRLGDLVQTSPIDFAGVKHRQRFTVVYTNKLTLNPCVIINDYTGTYLENNIIPRETLSNVSISDQAAVYRQLKNNVKLTAKKAIAVLESETQREAVEKVVNDLLDNDSPVIGITAKSISDVFKLHNIDTKMDIEGLLRTIETYERRRSNDIGISTRSPLDKKERLIVSEAENDDLISNIILQDGLVNRQIGIELMIKHKIITKGSVKINPILIQKESSEMDEKDNKKDDKNGK